MDKKVNNFLLFLGLLILYVIFSAAIVTMLKYVGLNISDLSVYKKTICLIAVDIVLMAIFYLVYRKENNTELIRYLKNPKKFLLFGFKVWIIGAILMISTNTIIHYLFPSAVALNEEAVQKSLKAAPLYTAFSACIFAPFTEEIIFRKSLRKVFNSNTLFIIISGLLFGLIHNISAIGTTQMLYIIPYGLFGCAFAYMYVKTNSIFVSITFHCFHNTLLVCYSFYSMGVF